MEENVLSAQLIISKWNLSSPLSKDSNLNTLYFDNTREEANKFCEAVNDLQRAMLYFSSKDCSESNKSKSSRLVHAQHLMQTAMKRLEKEFYQILSASSSITDPDSAVAMADLRTIARTMISAGYGRECLKIYVMIRKSIVDENMYKLGLENLTFSQIQKLDWKVLDFKIQTWLSGSGTVIHTLFTGERVLCDHVFDGYDSIREACFAEIAKEAAMHFLLFPELVAKSKKSPEKLFRLLDLFNAVLDLWVDIESVFSFESTGSVRSQASSTFLKLGEAVRFIVSEFETGIQKDGSKNLVPGGRIHPLTRYAMDYLVHLSDYEFALSEIYLDFPIQTSSPVSETLFDTSTNSSPSSYDLDSSSVPVRIAWMILVLLCKLDGKAEQYKEAALSYLFLANNLKYVVQRIKESKLRQILGEGWITKHELKVKHYASSCQRLSWARVAALVPVSYLPEKVIQFYESFEEAVGVQREWVVEDEGMKEEIKESVVDIILPSYRTFYDAYSMMNDNMCAPENLRIKLMELFSRSSDCYSGYGFGVSITDYNNGFNSSVASNKTLGSQLG